MFRRDNHHAKNFLYSMELINGIETTLEKDSEYIITFKGINARDAQPIDPEGGGALDPRTFAIPDANKVTVAAFIPNDDPEISLNKMELQMICRTPNEFGEKSTQNNKMIQTNSNSQLHDPLRYPLFFTFGENGYSSMLLRRAISMLLASSRSRVIIDLELEEGDEILNINEGFGDVVGFQVSGG